MKKIKKIFSFIFFNLVLFLIFITIFSGISWAAVRVEPARIILNALDKKHSTGLIEVINTGEEEIELKALLNDWALDENDGLIFYEAGETDYSLDGLIKFNPREFKIPPGKKQIVRFTISNPETAETIRERRGVVFFEQETGLIDAATGSNVKSQVGSVIYYIPESVKYDFKFNGLRVYKTSDSIPQGITIRVKNDGEAHLRYYPSYKIINSENKVVMEKSFSELIILPGYERQFAFYLEDRLKKGDYTFILSFRLYNTSYEPEYQIPITIE